VCVCVRAQKTRLRSDTRVCVRAYCRACRGDLIIYIVRPAKFKHAVLRGVRGCAVPTCRPRGDGNWEEDARAEAWTTVFGEKIAFAESTRNAFPATTSRTGWQTWARLNRLGAAQPSGFARVFQLRLLRFETVLRHTCRVNDCTRGSSGKTVFSVDSSRKLDYELDPVDRYVVTCCRQRTYRRVMNGMTNLL